MFSFVKRFRFIDIALRKPVFLLLRFLYIQEYFTPYDRQCQQFNTFFGEEFPGAFLIPGMLQDIEAHRRTEIDYFAGTVMMLGEKVDVPTPVNRVLYYAIKAKEKVGLAEKALEEEEL